jgi:hypothetical protein
MIMMNKTLKCTIDNDNNISSRKKHKFCFDEPVIVRKKPKHNYFPLVVDSHDKIKKQKKLKLKVKLASVNYSRKKARKEKLKITKALKSLEKSLNKKEAFVLKQEQQSFGLKTVLVLLFELIKIFITLWKFVVG